MKNLLFFISLISFYSFAQNELFLNTEGSMLEISVSPKLSYYEDPTSELSPEEFLKNKSSMKEVKMTTSVENLDFTHSSFFIHFSLYNKSGKDQSLVLEVARPITNKADLFCVNDGSMAFSGDGVAFGKKSIRTNFSALALFIPNGEKREYVLHLSSDGENLTAPMVFFERERFREINFDRQILMGVILGIFIFVVIIYLAFYAQLREKLFLVYVLYVASSGLLQFSLDGYMHQFIFQDGGYFSQHVVLLVAGPTVILGVLYTSSYLALSGIMKQIARVINVITAVTTVLSLIPGALYEFSYILINAFSFIALVYMMLTGFIQRSRNKHRVSILFLTGYVFLMLGGVVFILGNFGVVDFPLVTLNALKVGTTIEMIFLSITMAAKYKELQEERELVREKLLHELAEKHRFISELNVRLERDVQERTQEIETQKQELEEKNKDFLASVVYAERIQRAVLSNEEKFQNFLPNSFIFLKPKDVVSGDFFWIDKVKNDDGNDQVAYVTSDCTGKGVSAAFVSIVANHLLESVKASNRFIDPGKALDHLSSEVNSTLNSEYEDDGMHDGMDLSLCLLDLKNKTLAYSGAKSPACIVRNGIMFELKGDRKSIGFNFNKEDKHEFATYDFDLQQGDMIYTFTDGYSNQFGGENDAKFMKRHLKALFVEISTLTLEEQRDRLDSTLNEWIGEGKQIDDILIVGVQL